MTVFENLILISMDVYDFITRFLLSFSSIEVILNTQDSV